MSSGGVTLQVMSLASMAWMIQFSARNVLAICWSSRKISFFSFFQCYFWYSFLWCKTQKQYKSACTCSYSGFHLFACFSFLMFQSYVFFFFFLSSTVHSTSFEQSGWHHESISIWRKSAWKGQSLSPCTAKYPNLCWYSACHCCCQCTRHVSIMFALGDAVVETRVPLQSESSNLCPWIPQGQLW